MGLLLPVSMYGKNTVVWRKEGRFRITCFLVIKRTDIILNVRGRD